MAATRQPEQRWSAWQTADTGRLLVLCLALMLVVAALAQTAVGITGRNTAIAFGLFIAFGELMRLALPGGRQAAPIATTGALAYAMLLHVGTLGSHRPPAIIPPLQVIAVTAIGMSLGALPHVAVGRPAGLTGMGTRLVAVACAAFLFRPLVTNRLIWERWWAAFAVMAFVVTVSWVTETLLAALIRAADLRARFAVTLWDEVRVQWRLGSAIAASAVITVFGAEVMGTAELAVFAGPLLVIQLAFRRYAGIRATYLQTVRALARVTEVGGYVEAGHSQRVSRIAVAVGRELGMSEPELLDLEYAALMHDIGQLSLPAPIPGGATVLVSRDDQRRIAELGAEVICKAGVLDRVADLVRCQSLPWRGDREPPLASMIIKVANAFDDLVGGSADRDRVAAALDRLKLDSRSEYDPEVVSALAAVSGRRPLSRL
jgi:HD domain